MSIDAYTGVRGGGAVARLYRRLRGRPNATWLLENRTADGARIGDVDFQGVADLITMTIGGNDMLQNIDRKSAEFIARFDRAYSRLASDIRQAHPRATVIVGNIYQPNSDIFLTAALQVSLNEANRIIGHWATSHDFRLADIYGAFRGHEDEYLCLSIEPTLKGATIIADLFEQAAFGG